MAGSHRLVRYIIQLESQLDPASVERRPGGEGVSERAAVSNNSHLTSIQEAPAAGKEGDQTPLHLGSDAARLLRFSLEQSAAPLLSLSLTLWL